MRTCWVESCRDEVARQGLCWKHFSQKRRGEAALADPLAHERATTPWGLLVEAALTLADAEAGDDEGWDKAQEELARTAIRYARQAKEGGSRHTG